MVVLCLVVVVWELAQPQSAALRHKFRHKITQQIRIPQTFPAKSQKPPKNLRQIDCLPLKIVSIYRRNEVMLLYCYGIQSVIV